MTLSDKDLSSQKDISSSSDLLSSPWSRSQGALVTHQDSCISVMYSWPHFHRPVSIPFHEAAWFHRKDSGLQVLRSVSISSTHPVRPQQNHTLPSDSFCSLKWTMCYIIHNDLSLPAPSHFSNKKIMFIDGTPLLLYDSINSFCST